MMMTSAMATGSGPSRSIVEAACAAVLARPDARWTAERLAAAGGASTVQLQRAFRKVLGLSPRDYVVACRRKSFLARVKAGGRVTDAVYDAGFGSPSRVYDALRLPGMTPATYGKGGRGALIHWLTGVSAVGAILVAATDRGLCFVQVGEPEAMRRALGREFPLADIDARPSKALKPMLEAAVAVAAAKPLPAEISVDIRGTAFQWRVWRALTRIPRGQTRSYAELAKAIGRPSAVRAVARACATNPVTLVVPCHRVVPKAGGVGGYRWGAAVKRQILARERTR